MARALPPGTTVTVAPEGPLRGEARPPGDKSISHRSLIFNAMASGPARVRGLLRGEDVLGSMAAVRALGVTVDDDGDEVVVRGTGVLAEPTDVIDCGNSGTTIRLLAGLVAAEPFLTVLTGDASLRRRPMGRLARPLRAMGAHLDGRQGGERAPLVVRGATTSGGVHDLPVASAQLETAVLLAGRRHGVSVGLPGAARDHTERFLRGMGATLARVDGRLTLSPVDRLAPLDVDVPGDLSSAAFWMVAASIVPGSEVVLRHVGVNPTRAGVIDALRAMGANLEVVPVDAAGAEPIADVIVRAAPLHGARIDGDLALRALDELPVLAVAAAFAEGDTTIADAEELRVKESDRIARVAEGLRGLGVVVDERPDGMVVHGGSRPRGPLRIDGSGDHRIAMAFTVAGLAAEGGVVVDHADEASTSYPSFFDDLARLRG